MAPRIAYNAPPTNPLLQFLYLVVGALLLIGAVLMGAVILAFVIGFALVLGLVIWVRVWWYQRKLRKAAGSQHREGPKNPPADGGVEITEVEYRVVSESRPEDD